MNQTAYFVGQKVNLNGDWEDFTIPVWDEQFISDWCLDVEYFLGNAARIIRVSE
jgi:hypothetical protein